VADVEGSHRTLGRALSGASLAGSLWLGLLVTSGFLGLAQPYRFEARLSALYAGLAVLLFWVSRQCSPTPGKDVLWLARCFRFTLLVVALAGAALLVWRNPLLHWMVASAYDDGAPVYFPRSEALLATELVAVQFALSLVALPVFAAEAWLLSCSCLGSERARRFALPFGLVTALALWFTALVCLRLAGRLLYEELLTFSAGS
jgi:hypothetical protein